MNVHIFHFSSIVNKLYKVQNKTEQTVDRADNHNHVADILTARRGVILKRMNQAAVKDPTNPVRRLFDRNVEEDLGDLENLPSFEGVRTRVKRVRANLMPRIP